MSPRPVPSLRGHNIPSRGINVNGQPRKFLSDVGASAPLATRANARGQCRSRQQRSPRRFGSARRAVQRASWGRRMWALVKRGVFRRDVAQGVARGLLGMVLVHQGERAGAAATPMARLRPEETEAPAGIVALADPGANLVRSPWGDLRPALAEPSSRPSKRSSTRPWRPTRSFAPTAEQSIGAGPGSARGS